MMSTCQQCWFRRGYRTILGLAIVTAMEVLLTPRSTFAGMLVSAYGFHGVLQYDQITGESSATS